MIDFLDFSEGPVQSVIFYGAGWSGRAKVGLVIIYTLQNIATTYAVQASRLVLNIPQNRLHFVYQGSVFILCESGGG